MLVYFWRLGRWDDRKRMERGLEWRGKGWNGGKGIEMGGIGLKGKNIVGGGIERC